MSIDDYSWFSWVHFLKQQYEVPGISFNLSVWLKINPIAALRLRLRSDNGTKYVSENFEVICRELGIHCQLTNPCIPQ